MKQRGVFLIGLILITFYFFLFPRFSGKELILRPETYLVLDNAEKVPGLSAASDEELIAIHSGNTAVFLNSEHEIAGLYTSSSMAVDDSWLAYSSGEGIDILDSRGRLTSRIPDKGIPVSRNGNLYIFSLDRVSKVNPGNGSIYWSMEFVSPVTVLDGRHDRTLVGLLDGRVYLVGDSGEILLNYRPGGSRFEAVYGGVMSPDGKRIAIISGIDPQRFVLLEERKNGFRPVTHHDTGTDFRRGIPMGFVRGDRQLVYENIQNVSSVNLLNFNIAELPLKGSLAGWADDPVPGVLALLGAEGQGRSFKLLSRMNLTVLDSPVPAETTDITGMNDSIFITEDNAVGILEFSVQ